MSDIAVNTGNLAPVPQRGVAVVNVYSIYDVVGMVYMEPFYFHYDSQAVRFVSDLLCKDNAFSKHPGDFKVFRIGKYDINFGELSGVTPPVYICEVSSLVSVASAVKGGI